MATVKIKGDNGETKEVQVSADQVKFDDGESPEGFVSQSKLNNDILPSRLDRKERTVKESLKQDESFVQEAAKSLGIDVSQKASELKKKAAQLDRVKSDLEQANKKVDRFKSVQFENELLKSDPNFDPNMADVAKSYVEKKFEYDESMGFVKKDQDGDVEYNDSGEPVKIKGYIESLKSKKPGFFKNRSIEPDNSDSSITSSNVGQKMYTKEEYNHIRDNGSDEEWKKATKALMDGRVNGL